MKTTDNATYRMLNRHRDLIIDLHSRGRPYREIAYRVEELERIPINRKRISDFVRIEVEARRYNPNMTVKDYTFGSDVYQIKKHFERVIESVPRIESPNNSRFTGNGFNVLCLADLHIGQLIKPIDVDFENSYSEEVIVSRLERVLGQISNLENKDKLHVFTLGDLVHGDLPNKQDFLLSQEYGVITQTLKATWIIKDFFQELLKQFNQVEVYTVSGNHGRLPNKSHMPNQQRSENFDWMLIEYLKEFLKDNNDRITFKNSEGFYSIFDINNVRFGITHGHQLGGDPIKMFHEVNAQYCPERGMDMLVHGHFHHYTLEEMAHHKKIIGVGSLVGADPFARNQLLRSSIPSQLLLQFEDDSESDRPVLTNIRQLYVD